MTWIKICGITNLEDALVAVEAGADALGFVFYEKSPRNMIPEKAHEIAIRLSEKIEKVGVFVNASGFAAVDVARLVGLTAIQNVVGFDGSDVPESKMVVAIAGFPHPPKLFLAFPAHWVHDRPERLHDMATRLSHLRRDSAERYQGCFDTFFLDSSTCDQPGGTGKTFDWEKTRSIADQLQDNGLKLVVAGGLTAENVAEAMHILHPWGVDVSSGVEARPGKKDPEKVRAFIKAVREADKANSN
ncbi:MAG TPA: phosphoribosylanthranilate isomerase [Terriglobales bacterium]|jgi:phosphoribosylanthranilate isomerase